MNKSLLRLGVGALIGVLGMTTSLDVAALNIGEGKLPAAATTPLAFARKAQPKGVFKAQAEANLTVLRSKIGPATSLEPSNEAGYLDGPNGQIWYFTCKYDIEKIVHSEYYTEKKIKGYEYTVYNSELKKVGTIKDQVRLEPEEMTVAAVGIDPTVTRKFFNSDDKYEVCIAVSVARQDHTIHSYTLAYSLGAAADSEGNTPVLAQFEGYIVDAIDAAADQWAEKMLLTFMTETSANIEDMPEDAEWIDYLATFKNVLKTYRSSYYEGTVLLNTFEIPMLNLPGDGISTAFFFTKKTADNKIYFTTQQYEKSFFVDPSGMGGNEDITPDNSLIISNFVYPDTSAKELTPLTKTVIPATPMTDGGYLCSYYSVGNMLGTDDIDFEMHGTPERPAYFVSVQNYTSLADEKYTSMYYLYDNEGTKKATIAEYCESVIGLTDVPGTGRQAMFVQEDIQNYIFKFVDLAKCAEVLSIPSTYNGYRLSVNMDRFPVGDSYEYVIETSENYSNERGEVLVKIMRLAPDGTIAKIDEVNIGTDVAYAKFFIDASALSPYVFNTDATTEYMSLVKRYIDLQTQGTLTREELVVAGAGKDTPLLVITPDETKGVLSMVSLLGEMPNKKLMVIFVDEDAMYSQDIYNLPLERFDGGNGTNADPYRIASIGDLQAIAGDVTASYTIVDDIDASNFAFVPVDGFSGVLQGNHHTIRNLTLSPTTGGAGIFAEVSGAEIRNLTLDGVNVNLGAGNRYSGVVAGTVNGRYVPGGGDTPVGAVIDDIHIYNLKVNGNDFEDTFGGIVGRATLGTTVSNVLIKDAEIKLPLGAVGGIAGQLLTGATVKSSAFDGIVIGGVEVGGIASSAAKGCVLTNNHFTGKVIGDNTLGGILGNSTRATVNNNIFRGEIMSTKANKWTRNIAVGGIIGRLEAPASDATDADAIIVSRNIADIAWIGTPTLPDAEEWAGQHATVHRIVGWSRVNADTYGEPAAEADKGLADNYALEGFKPIDSTVGAAATSAEGADIDRWHYNDIFLGSLGFAHGMTTEAPWNLATGNPNLYFENVIVIETPEVKATDLASTFVIPMIVTARVPVPEADLLGDLTCEYDETHYEMTGNYTFDGTRLNLEMRPLKEGLSDFTVKTLGSSARTRVYTGAAGVDNVIADTDADAPVEYFDMQGRRVVNPAPGQILIERRGSTVTKIVQ